MKKLLHYILLTAISIVILYILAQAGKEFLQTVPGSRPLAGKLTGKWAFTVVELVLFCIIVGAGLLAAGLWVATQATRKGEASKGRMLRPYVEWRWRLRWLSGLAAFLLACFPAFFLLETYWGDLFSGPYLRLLLLLSTSFLVGMLIPTRSDRLVEVESLAFSAVFVGGIYTIAGQLIAVTDYPFSLTWSEGNRIYEYSIYFGAGGYIYPGELTAIRQASGRYLLWGLPFLIPAAPIWVHRLWNAILSTAPHLALGYLIAWRYFPWTTAAEGQSIQAAKNAANASEGRSIQKKDASPLQKWIFALWAFLFLAQGPIYTPLILSAILIVLFVRVGARWQWLAGALATGIAGYYASLSRWTWLPAAPAWAAFILLAELEAPTRNSSKKVSFLKQPAFWLTGLVAAVGLVGGLLANPKLFQPQKISQSTALSQPLLWYRLFPNATYPEGVMLALILATAPLLALLIWLAISRRWRLNGWQILVYIGACLVFLGGGLVASVKIGGGNNLHNLDMFLVSLAVLSGLALRSSSAAGIGDPGYRKSNGSEYYVDPSSIKSSDVEYRANLSYSWPPLAQALLALVIFLPAWGAIRSGSPLKLPPDESVRKALQSIRTLTAEASQSGEVLFMDQRQLLTFGEVKGVPLVAEYEKKYMMDQAMAGDAAFFEGFYRDLAEGRFTLIVSDMLFLNQKDNSYAFAEENNAWVKWVSEPLLCYYMPLRTMQNVDIQLLVPNPNAANCTAGQP